MSPVPSPMPLRRTVLRFMFSPAVLACSFVAYLILTCPNARGDSGVGLAAAGGIGQFTIPGGSDILALGMLPYAVGPAENAPAGKSAPASPPTYRSGISGKQLPPAATDTVAAEPFQHSRVVVPLLVEPLRRDVAESRLSPMTGPAVGVRHKVPAAQR